MDRHDADPAEGAAPEVGNRAPCRGCGKALVACSLPSDYARVYWRHDRFASVLVRDDDRSRWALADVQVGPMAALGRIAMREAVDLPASS